MAGNNNHRKDQETTARLEKILTDIKGDETAQLFIDKHSGRAYDTFSQYFNAYIAEKDLTVATIVKKSNISKNYVYNIINGDRSPGRDKIIALCIGAGMNYSETNRALKIAKAGSLYPKDERDARIAIAINQGIDNVLDINIILERENLPILE